MAGKSLVIRSPAPTRSPKRKRLESRDKVAAVMTSLAIPLDLHQRVAMAALRLNWSFAEIARAALTEWLARHAPDRGTRR